MILMGFYLLSAKFSKRFLINCHLPENPSSRFLSFFPYLELVSAGTNGIELRILKNGTPFITIEGRPEMTANAIPYILKRPVSLVTGDILTSQIRNDASTIDIRVRAFGLRVEAN